MHLGAHVSIAESFALAPERGRAVGAEVIQIFSRSPRMLQRTKPVAPDEARQFQEALTANGIVAAVIHGNYLINLATPDKRKLKFSRVAFVEELERAQALGLRDVIFHPGAGMGSKPERAVKTVAQSLDWCFEHAKAPDVFAVLENTAGQGTVVGSTWEEIAGAMEGSENPDRLALCVDTCHTFAAGYDFRTREGYDSLFRTIDETVGLGRIRAFHLNDSKGDLGSHADRHEDVGKGKLGIDPFRFLVNDERFRKTPGCLEYPGTEGGYRRELKTLRTLVTGADPPTSPRRPTDRRARRGTASGTRTAPAPAA